MTNETNSFLDSDPRHPRNPRSCICLAFGLLLICPQCFAQTTLRWKLAPGQKLAVAMTQKTTSEVAYSGKKTSTAIDLSAELTWKVLGAENDQFTIEQSLDRMTLVIEAPAVGRVEYDSDPQARNPASAGEIAAAVKPFLDTKIEITMNDRGEIVAAKPLAPVPMGEIKPDAAIASLFSKQTVQQLLKQSLVVLPQDPVTRGDTWTTSSDLASAMGKAKQTTTYRYAGAAADEDAGRLDRIAFTTKLELTPAAAAKQTLKEHQQTGTIEFDSAAGRVVSAEQSQKIVTERPYAATTIVVTLDSSQNTTVAVKESAP
jgi:hypothetical protein